MVLLRNCQFVCVLNCATDCAMGSVMTERELMAIALESSASLPSVRKWAKGKPLTESVRRSVEAAAVRLGIRATDNSVDGNKDRCGSV